MGLAEGVAAGDQCDRFFVVHRHTSKRFAYIYGRSDRIGVAVGTFRIDVDQTHLHRTERVLKLAFAAVPLVAEPCSLGAPVELFGLPYIGAATREAQRLEPHRLERDVACEYHQVAP